MVGWLAGWLIRVSGREIPGQEKEKVEVESILLVNYQLRCQRRT